MIRKRRTMLDRSQTVKKVKGIISKFIVAPSCLVIYTALSKLRLEFVMNITYNGESQSLTYATPSESDVSSRLRVYPVSGLVGCNQWCRSLHWRRIILATSLLLSFSAFSLSLITFIHLTNSKIHGNNGQLAKLHQMVSIIQEGDFQVSTVSDIHTVSTFYPTEVADFPENGSGDASDIISTNNVSLKDFLLQHTDENIRLNRQFLEILCTELDTLKSTVKKSNLSRTVKIQDTANSKAVRTRPNANGTNTQKMDEMDERMKLLQNKTDYAVKELNGLKDSVSTAWPALIANKANVEEGIRKIRNETLLLFQGYEGYVNSSLKNATNHFLRLLFSTRNGLAQTNRTTRILMQQIAGLVQMKENLSKLQWKMSGLENKFADNKRISAMSQHFSQNVQRSLVAMSSTRNMALTANRSVAAVEKLLSKKADWGWIQAPNGYAYHVTAATFTSWYAAKSTCQKLNSTLAYVGVRSNTMKDFIFSLLIHPRGENVWIGLSDLGKEGTWKWLDGRQLNQFPTNWAPTQPNNINRENADQDCAEIDKTDGKWNDVWCRSKKNSNNDNAALCERKI